MKAGLMRSSALRNNRIPEVRFIHLQCYELGSSFLPVPPNSMGNGISGNSVHCPLTTAAVD